MVLGLGMPKSKKDPSPFRSTCPVSSILDILGDKWTLLIVRDLLLGQSRFKDFIAAEEGITTNILSDRLDRLQRFGVIEKVMSEGYPKHPEYRLTKRGEELSPIIGEMIRWSLRNLESVDLPPGTPWSS
ncbi:MAG: DNA-binding HxlR family transcriptional regulator [Candidatus Omnitrophota bacterium]|jgi:DNA-binding HxlR family transcriptional regulator